MKCEKCGAEMMNLSVGFFNHDGSDRYVEVAPYLHENGAVVLDLTPNWTGYELSEEEAMETISCPHCGSFPFEHKEVQVYTIIRTVCFRKDEELLGRDKAATIIENRVHIDNGLLDGEPVSDFDKFVAEQDEAMELAAKMLRDPVPMLTPTELRKAYEIQQHNYDVSDILNELDCASEDYVEEFGIDENPVTEEELEQMAYVLRRKMEADADACWSQCRAEAVAEVLRKRPKPARYVIGRPINGVTINGLEYVLNDDGDEIIFDSIEEAKEFLYAFDMTDKDIEAQGIQFVEVDE